MKILQIIPQLTEAGAEVFVVDLCNELIKYHEVHLIVFYDNKHDDFIYKRLSSKIKIYYLNKSLGFDISIVKKSRRLIKKIKPQIIHTHLIASNYIFLVYSFTKINSILFHTVHNDAFKEASKLFRKINKYFFSKRNIKAVTISNESNISFKKAYKNTSSILINNGRKTVKETKQIEEITTNLNRLRNNNEYKLLLNIGRITYQKNHPLLVDTINELNAENVKIKLIIIGGERSSFKEGFKYVNDNLSNEIIYLGKKSNATDYLFLVDGFCLSSRYEGLPISILEAISVGCIPISTPAGGVPQIIQNKDYGFLADGFEKEHLKEAIKKWYYSTEQQNNIIKNNIKVLYEKNYSMESCAKKYMDAFTQALSLI